MVAYFCAVSTPPAVATTSGPVRGIRTDGVVAFLGIPYAHADRFKPPAPPERWTEVRDAFDFGPIAPQAGGAQFQRSDLAQSEDCLSLNVWTPSLEGRRPVMVWIHGGGFRQGSGASPLYDGAALAGRDVVVISINYRLGPLGFLAHPDLGGGNWGLQDQIEALRWVRTNAAAFGGDPGNVTVFGESAGAVSVWLLCASPLARGLFHKAIAQSGGPIATGWRAATRMAEEAAAALGVSVAGLTDVPVADLLGADPGTEMERAFVPCIDGTVLDGRPVDNLAGVPMIVGTNVDEWKLWAPTDPHSRDLDELRLRRRLDQRLPGRAEEAIAAVRAIREDRGEPAAPNDLWFAIETERFFRVPAIRAVEAQLRVQPQTFVYLFAWDSPALRGWLGACHGLEIAFVFGNQGRGELASFTGQGPEADALADEMMRAWVAFANGGDPGWPRYDTSARPTMVYDRVSRVEMAPRDAERVAVDQAMGGAR